MKDIHLKLEHIQFWGGNKAIPTATVVITHDGQTFTETATGSTQADAVVKAINRALKLEVEAKLNLTVKDGPFIEYTVNRKGEIPYFGRERLLPNDEFVITLARCYLAAVNLMISDDGKPPISSTREEERWRKGKFGG